MVACVRPVRDISRLKSPHRMWVWLGCVCICMVIVYWIMGISSKLFGWEGIYMWISNQGMSGLFAMSMIWRYGDMFVGVGI